ncbi:hypothetical protein SNEBB_007942 [Seison nebaliae]|nr:hypothetical protein SNEBB_007942 [Seison nebaliae]
MRNNKTTERRRVLVNNSPNTSRRTITENLNTPYRPVRPNNTPISHSRYIKRLRIWIIIFIIFLIILAVLLPTVFLTGGSSEVKDEDDSEFTTITTRLAYWPPWLPEEEKKIGTRTYMLNSESGRMNIKMPKKEYEQITDDIEIELDKNKKIVAQIPKSQTQPFQSFSNGRTHSSSDQICGMSFKKDGVPMKFSELQESAQNTMGVKHVRSNDQWTMRKLSLNEEESKFWQITKDTESKRDIKIYKGTEESCKTCTKDELGGIFVQSRGEYVKDISELQNSENLHSACIIFMAMDACFHLNTTCMDENICEEGRTENIPPSKLSYCKLERDLLEEDEDKIHLLTSIDRAEGIVKIIRNTNYNIETDIVGYNTEGNLLDQKFLFEEYDEKMENQYYHDVRNIYDYQNQHSYYSSNLNYGITPRICVGTRKERYRICKYFVEIKKNDMETVFGNVRWDNFTSENTILNFLKELHDGMGDDKNKFIGVQKIPEIDSIHLLFNLILDCSQLPKVLEIYKGVIEFTLSDEIIDSNCETGFGEEVFIPYEIFPVNAHNVTIKSECIDRDLKSRDEIIINILNQCDCDVYLFMPYFSAIATEEKELTLTFFGSGNSSIPNNLGIKRPLEETFLPSAYKRQYSNFYVTPEIKSDNLKSLEKFTYRLIYEKVNVSRTICSESSQNVLMKFLFDTTPLNMFCEEENNGSETVIYITSIFNSNTTIKSKINNTKSTDLMFHPLTLSYTRTYRPINQRPISISENSQDSYEPDLVGKCDFLKPDDNVIGMQLTTLYYKIEGPEKYTILDIMLNLEPCSMIFFKDFEYFQPTKTFRMKSLLAYEILVNNSNQICTVIDKNKFNIGLPIYIVEDKNGMLDQFNQFFLRTFPDKINISRLNVTSLNDFVNKYHGLCWRVFDNLHRFNLVDGVLIYSYYFEAYGGQFRNCPNITRNEDGDGSADVINLDSLESNDNYSLQNLNDISISSPIVPRVIYEFEFNELFISSSLERFCQSLKNMFITRKTNRLICEWFDNKVEFSSIDNDIAFFPELYKMEADKAPLVVFKPYIKNAEILIKKEIRNDMTETITDVKKCCRLSINLTSGIYPMGNISFYTLLNNIEVINSQLFFADFQPLVKIDDETLDIYLYTLTCDNIEETYPVLIALYELWENTNKSQSEFISFMNKHAKYTKITLPIDVINVHKLKYCKIYTIKKKNAKFTCNDVFKQVIETNEFYKIFYDCYQHNDETNLILPLTHYQNTTNNGKERTDYITTIKFLEILTKCKPEECMNDVEWSFEKNSYRILQNEHIIYSIMINGKLTNEYNTNFSNLKIVEKSKKIYDYVKSKETEFTEKVFHEMNVVNETDSDDSYYNFIMAVELRHIEVRNDIVVLTIFVSSGASKTATNVDDIFDRIFKQVFENKITFKNIKRNSPIQKYGFTEALDLKDYQKTFVIRNLPDDSLEKIRKIFFIELNRRHLISSIEIIGKDLYLKLKKPIYKSAFDNIVNTAHGFKENYKNYTITVIDELIPLAKANSSSNLVFFIKIRKNIIKYLMTTPEMRDIVVSRLFSELTCEELGNDGELIAYHFFVNEQNLTIQLNANCEPKPNKSETILISLFNITFKFEGPKLRKIEPNSSPIASGYLIYNNITIISTNLTNCFDIENNKSGLFSNSLQYIKYTENGCYLELFTNNVDLSKLYNNNLYNVQKEYRFIPSISLGQLNVEGFPQNNLKSKQTKRNTMRPLWCIELYENKEPLNNSNTVRHNFKTFNIYLYHYQINDKTLISSWKEIVERKDPFENGPHEVKMDLFGDSQTFLSLQNITFTGNIITLEIAQPYYLSGDPDNITEVANKIAEKVSYVLYEKYNLSKSILESFSSESRTLLETIVLTNEDVEYIIKANDRNLVELNATLTMNEQLKLFFLIKYEIYETYIHIYGKKYRWVNNYRYGIKLVRNASFGVECVGYNGLKNQLADDNERKIQLRNYQTLENRFYLFDFKLTDEQKNKIKTNCPDQKIVQKFSKYTLLKIISVNNTTNSYDKCDKFFNDDFGDKYHKIRNAVQYQTFRSISIPTANETCPSSIPKYIPLDAQIFKFSDNETHSNGLF